MRTALDPRLAEGRLMSPWGCESLTGAFQVNGPCGMSLRIVASEGDPNNESMGWSHVSISTKNRCPNWTEMCWVKDLFFEPEECVVQFHPPRSKWISNHPYCLHLWKPPYQVELPPAILVGIQSAGEIDAKEAARLLRLEMGKR